MFSQAKIIFLFKKKYFSVCTKGQLISKCLCEKIVSTKIPTKKFDRFCPASFIQTRYVNYALYFGLKTKIHLPLSNDPKAMFLSKMI